VYKHTRGQREREREIEREREKQRRGKGILRGGENRERSFHRNEVFLPLIEALPRGEEAATSFERIRGTTCQFCELLHATEKGENGMRQSCDAQLEDNPVELFGRRGSLGPRRHPCESYLLPKSHPEQVPSDVIPN